MDEIQLKKLVKQHLHECLQHKGRRGIIQVYDPHSWQPKEGKQVLIAFVPLDELPNEMHSVASQRYLSRNWDFDNEFIAMLVPSFCAKAIRCTECGSPEKLQRCARCRNAAYCSVDCQRKDWGEHKLRGITASPAFSRDHVSRVV